jgi:hypothetical protein
MVQYGAIFSAICVISVIAKESGLVMRDEAAAAAAAR